MEIDNIWFVQYSACDTGHDRVVRIYLHKYTKRTRYPNLPGNVGWIKASKMLKLCAWRKGLKRNLKTCSRNGNR